MAILLQGETKKHSPLLTAPRILSCTCTVKLENEQFKHSRLTSIPLFLPQHHFSTKTPPRALLCCTAAEPQLLLAFVPQSGWASFVPSRELASPFLRLILPHKQLQCQQIRFCCFLQVPSHGSPGELRPGERSRGSGERGREQRAGHRPCNQAPRSLPLGCGWLENAYTPHGEQRNCAEEPHIAPFGVGFSQAVCVGRTSVGGGRAKGQRVMAAPGARVLSTRGAKSKRHAGDIYGCVKQRNLDPDGDQASSALIVTILRPISSS